MIVVNVRAGQRFLLIDLHVFDELRLEKRAYYGGEELLFVVVLGV